MLDSNHREALLLRSRLRFQTHRSQDALNDAERALAFAPPDLEALNLLGSIQSALGLKEKAAATFEERRQVERRLEMIRDLSHQVAQRPADAEPRWRLGHAAANAGMKPLAAQCYHAALALAPTAVRLARGSSTWDSVSPRFPFARPPRSPVAPRWARRSPLVEADNVAFIDTPFRSRRLECRQLAFVFV